ncbi:MAG TPA: uracil-DNA glycosylase family protein [Bacteroidia bacterium]|jgi:uracil-DNA glycosylase family 4|nr:uracil-DNA glycosylase family protein [Bacteroidia bacterium]
MDRCPLCPGKNPIVPPCGPEKCSVMLIGEAPGKEESKYGRPFVGKTGQELTEHYLPLAGLRRGDIRITNTVACYPTSSEGKLDHSNPKDAAMIRSCAEHHLYRQIKETNPELIIPAGGVIASLIPGLDLDVHFAFPFIWDVPGDMERAIFPIWHPARGIHEPKFMLHLRSCFIRLRKYLKGELIIPQDKYPNPDFGFVLNTSSAVDEYIQQDTECNMALDTEITRNGTPFCLTFSVRPGTARLIQAGDSCALGRLAWWIQRWKGHILLHNRLFDRPILKRMGVPVPHHLIIDTMAEAYHLGNMPQGLKTLAYRFLGAEMQSFDDLVRPYSTYRILEYYARGLQEEWSRPSEECIRDTKGEWKGYKPQSFGTKLKRFFTDLAANPNLDVFDRWGNWEMHHEEIEAKLGPYPGKCISHTPLEKILPYACQDAARTLELWPIQERAERLVRKKSAYEWFNL